MTTAVFSVNQWGSHPDAGNDDCWNGDDYPTLEEAHAKFVGKWRFDVAFVALEGPGVYEVRANPDYRAPASHENDDWASERMWQHRMGFGTDD
jgi:hypothetical protein